jgi:hypothetical protein
MEYLIGVLLAAGVIIFSALVGLDRERSFYATALIVIASYYALFAVMGGSRQALIIEILAASVFCVLAALGFRRSLWLLAAGMVGHGLFDFARHGLIENAGVPPWWPGFCGAFDVVFGGWLALRLLQKSSLMESRPATNK